MQKVVVAVPTWTNVQFPLILLLHLLFLSSPAKFYFHSSLPFLFHCLSLFFFFFTSFTIDFNYYFTIDFQP